MPFPGSWYRGGSPRRLRSTAQALQSGLVAFWKLDEVSGVRNDSVGANHLTDNNTVTQAVGKVGNAAQFTTANSESLSIVDNAALSMGDIDFTIAGWVYLDSVLVDQPLVSKRQNATNREYLVQYVAGGTNRFRFGVTADGVTFTLLAAASLGAPLVATWYFVVSWHDATANTINIQVNNGAVDSGAHATGVFDGTSIFELGADTEALAFLGGRLDACGIWKRVLTPAERTYLYNAGAGREYPFT